MTLAQRLATGGNLWEQPSVQLAGIRLRRIEVLDVDAALNREGPPYAHQLGAALRGGWDGAKALVLVLVALWPLWLAAGLGWLAWRVKRRHAKGASANAAGR